MRNMKWPILTLTILLISCSQGGGGSSGVTAPKSQENLESDMTGIYMARLTSVNPAIAGKINGSVTVLREKEDFIADVRVASAPGSSMHVQNIHAGSRCPDLRDDLNGDGLIDGNEAAAVVGKILIPLDDDLSSQWMGLGTFPLSDEFGNYFWSRTTSFEKMVQDLKENDINPADDYSKLMPSKKFEVKSLVVLISGVPDAYPLPETVIERGRLTKAQSFPVACGVFTKIEKAPGVVDVDRTNIPLPEGETIGGGNGSDDGADFSRTGTTTGGNYGEDDSDEEVDTTSNETEFGGGTTGTI